MDLSAYITPLRRWWWLLVISTLVAGIASFIVTLNKPPVYKARTTLMIGQVINNPNPDQGEIYLAQSLAQAYSDMANREPVKNATMEALGLTWLPRYQASTVPRTQLIEITVTDTNPLRAQVVANELANQLILRSPTSSGSEDQDRREFISTQLSNLELQIKLTEEDISNLQDQLGTLNSASQLQDTQNQILAMQAKLATLQGNYAALLANTQQGAINTLSIVEAAGLPKYPVGQNQIVIILLSAVIGFTLAAGAAYLLEYLDDTFKTPDEISQSLGIPIIGLIGEIREDKASNGTYVSKNPRSPIAEAYRNLRANLEYSAVNMPVKTIMITSVDVNVGKSSVATNLSVVLAHGERQVVLVDADLRKPSIHQITNISSEVGLSDLFRNGATISDAITFWADENISVITAGDIPPNPAELLSSRRMEDILSKLSEMSDIVVIDSAPFIVSDALFLATKVDGVLIVIRPDHTRKKHVLAMIDQLNRVGARILGVVLNRVPRRSVVSYGGYQYSSHYYSNGYYSSEEDIIEDKEIVEQFDEADQESNAEMRLNGSPS